MMEKYIQFSQNVFLEKTYVDLRLTNKETII